MSNNKPTATAVIRFFADKKVTVELDTLIGVSPRRLERANHLLMREYRGMRGAHNARRHQEAREAKIAADAKAVTDDAAWHEAEDERLVEDSESPEETVEAFEESVEERECPDCGYAVRVKKDNDLYAHPCVENQAKRLQAETSIPEGGDELT